MFNFLTISGLFGGGCGNSFCKPCWLIIIYVYILPIPTENKANNSIKTTVNSPVSSPHCASTSTPSSTFGVDPPFLSASYSFISTLRPVLPSSASASISYLSHAFSLATIASLLCSITAAFDVSTPSKFHDFLFRPLFSGLK